MFIEIKDGEKSYGEGNSKVFALNGANALLCDEVTGALDSKSSIEVLKLLQKVNEKFGMTIVIITHDESIKEIANRVIEIKDGQVISNEVREIIHEIEQVMG